MVREDVTIQLNRKQRSYLISIQCPLPMNVLPHSGPAATTRDVSTAVQSRLGCAGSTFSFVVVPSVDWHNKRTAKWRPRSSIASAPAGSLPHAPRKTVGHPVGQPYRLNSMALYRGHNRSSWGERSSHQQTSALLNRRIAGHLRIWRIVARSIFWRKEKQAFFSSGSFLGKSYQSEGTLRHLGQRMRQKRM